LPALPPAVLDACKRWITPVTKSREAPPIYPPALSAPRRYASMTPPFRGSSIVSDPVSTELIAVVTAVTGGEPRVLTINRGTALPSGSFETSHRSLQAGLRSWVERQTHQPLGYVEQLYTFADSDRAEAQSRSEAASRVLSISYLALTRETRVSGAQAGWQSWYRYFPWEDHRDGTPACLAATILPALTAWAVDEARRDRAATLFGADGRPWNEDFSLQRYELLYEAGLVPEWTRRHGQAAADASVLGEPMMLDHRRILATGIARLRAKIKYRPVFFELMPETFTLLQLQQTVEALAGRRLHKQNFRRLIDAQALVEDTGAVAQDTGGRPAKLFRYRRDVQTERAVAATRLPLARSK
jgi:hypothetical protein